MKCKPESIGRGTRLNYVFLRTQLADPPVHFRDEHHLLEVARADATAGLVATDEGYA